MSNQPQHSDGSFRAYTAPPNTVLTDEYQSRLVSELQSDHFIPLISAMKESTATIMARMDGVESETKKIYAELKKEMHILKKETALRANESGSMFFPRSESTMRETSKGNGIRGRQTSTKEVLPGLDVLCDTEKLSAVVSNWICNRTDGDLTKFWETEATSNRNSTLSVMLFGVPRREGHRPYSTSLGKDMGFQAREIVSKLIWNARCSVKCRSKYNSPVPKWILSLVPVCRKSLLGNEGSELLARRAHSLPSSGASGGTPRSNSTTGTIRSQTTIVNDYADFTNRKLGWEKEKIYFRDAVMKGCQACERPQRRCKNKDGKVARNGQADVQSQSAFNRNLSIAKAKLPTGAKGIRTQTNKFLSVNRVKVREKFFDIVGFILYNVTQMDIHEGRERGFFIVVSSLNDDEISILTSPEKFRSTIRASKNAELSHDDSDSDVNLEVLDARNNVFPSLIIKCSYSLTIGNKNDDSLRDDGERRSTEEEEDGCDPIPDTWAKTDNVNLIQLSLILLTEYTRAMSSNTFLSSSEKSAQAVIVIAFALRALICRTIEQPLLSFYQFILGNVYFRETEIPSRLVEVSTIMAFTDDKSNRSRLENKINITAKEYRAMRLVSSEHVEEQPDSSEDFEMENNDVFILPSDDDENLQMV